MKKVFFAITSLLAIVLMLASFVYAGNTLQVSADVAGDMVSIDVPSTLHLGNVARGFDTNETNKITITNNGNTRVTITPELVGSDALFSNLYMKRIQSESYKKIGQFSINISRPSTLGGSSTENVYIKLDLTNYEGALDSGTVRKNASVRFVAVAS